MFFGKESYDKIAIEEITKAIGPAPWYWKTFPKTSTIQENNLEWSFLGTKGENAYLVTLNNKNNADDIKLVLNTYTRPFFIGMNYLGLWYSEKGILKLKCFACDNLHSFGISDIPKNFKNSKEPYFTLDKPVSEICIDKQCNEGTYELFFPDEFKYEDEILIVDLYNINDIAHAIFCIYPQKGIYIVKPQKWFNGDKFDLGYQWITRVTRHPKSKRIIGDGIRIGAFELKKNECEIERWLKNNI